MRKQFDHREATSWDWIKFYVIATALAVIATDLIFEMFTKWNWELFEYDWPYQVLWLVTVLAFMDANREALGCYHDAD